MTVTFLAGAIAIVGGAGGQLAGGVIVWKIKLSVKGIFKLSIVGSILSLFCLLVFLMKCPEIRKFLVNIVFLPHSNSGVLL